MSVSVLCGVWGSLSRWGLQHLLNAGQNVCFVRGQGAWWPGALLVLLRAFLGLWLPPAPPEEASG